MDLSDADVLTLAIGAVGAILTAYVTGRQLGKEVGKDSRDQLKRDVAELRSTADSQRAKLAKLVKIEASQSQIDLRQRLNAVLLEDDRDVWRAFPAIRPPRYVEHIQGKKPIVVSIASLKGGVGKTTLTLNLAAHFSKNLKKRVLLIDADYQGSSSDVLWTVAQKTAEKSTHRFVDDWLTEAAAAPFLVNSAVSGGAQLPNVSFVPAFFSLASIENRILVDWLLCNILSEQHNDVRYSIARTLMDPSALGFDVVLIDCPPRFSTATIAALCASTHVVMPSIPDRSSLEASVRFIQMADALLMDLNPYLEFVGLVPWMSQATNLNQHEIRAIDRFNAAVPERFSVTRLPNIRHATAFGAAARERIVLLEPGNNDLKATIRSIGDATARLIGL